jgi:hypothetical protein
MKKLCLRTAIALFFLICSIGIHAQTSTLKLNQVELIKQFISNWKGEVGKDTTALWEIKSNGSGIECNFKFETKDKMFMEGKQLWVYDNKNDKFRLFSASNPGDTEYFLWFISNSKSVIVPPGDIANPEKASYRLEMEFISHDMFIQKTIINNKITKTETYNRVKN